MFSIADTELRPLASGDLRQVLQWRNSDRIRSSMFTSQIISWEEHTSWFERLQHRTDQAVLLFSYKSKGIGIINFTKIDKTNCCCEWGFYIGIEDAVPGSGTMMGLLGLAYAFDQLGMATIYGQCFVTNIASIRYHEKLGFTFKCQAEVLSGSQGSSQEVMVFELKKTAWEKRKKNLYPQIFAEYKKVMVKTDD